MGAPSRVMGRAELEVQAQGGHGHRVLAALPSHIPSEQSSLPVPTPVLCQRRRSPEGHTRRAPSWSRSVRLLASTLNFSAQASRSSFTPTTGAVGRQG